MISNWLSAALARRNIHYGWVMVGVTFLTALITAGTVGAPGVFIVPLQKEFGWTTAEISSALSIRFILFGLMAPFAAALMNRYGLRNVTLLALLIVVSGLVASLAMTQVWQLMLLWGVVIGLGTGMTALVLGATDRRALVRGAARPRGRHPHRERRHRAARVPAAAGEPDRDVWLADRAGADLRDAGRGRLRRADGHARPPERCRPAAVRRRRHRAAAGAAAEHRADHGGGARHAARCLEVAGVLDPVRHLLHLRRLTNGLIQVHLIPMCLDFGIPQVQAASLLAAMGIFDFVGTIASGWLSDRYDNRWLLFWYYGLRGLSLLFLPFTDFSFYGLSLFAMFYGLDWIATVPPTVRLTAQRFGPERANLVFGWIFAGHQLGAGVAAFGAGLSRTVLQTYLPAFFVAGALCIVAALIVLAISRPKPVAA